MSPHGPATSDVPVLFYLCKWGPRGTQRTGWCLGCSRDVCSPGLLFQDSLDAMLQGLLQEHCTEEVQRAGLCAEGALLLLAMLKATMNQVRPAPHMP